jgi:hypothetical protein
MIMEIIFSIVCLCIDFIITFNMKHLRLFIHIYCVCLIDVIQSLYSQEWESRQVVSYGIELSPKVRSYSLLLCVMCHVV